MRALAVETWSLDCFFSALLPSPDLADEIVIAKASFCLYIVRAAIMISAALWERCGFWFFARCCEWADVPKRSLMGVLVL